jgi:hypothetical protein
MTCWSIATQCIMNDLGTLTSTNGSSLTQKNAQVGEFLPWGLHFNLYSYNVFIINYMYHQFLIDNLEFL